MKFVCTQTDLNTNLSLVSRAVPSKPTHPVLGNILLVADVERSRVQLTAFDLSLGIRTSFAAQVEASGELTIPAKLLADIVSRLAEGEIVLDSETASGMVTLTSKSGRYQVRSMGAEEFPELPSLESSKAIVVPAEALIGGLKGSLFATSADETKQVLTGVHLKIQKDGIEFAATDGHRLAVVETINQNETDEDEDEPAIDKEEFEVTVPARALRELERMAGMLKGDSNAIALHFEQGQLVLEIADQRLTSRTLEGQYPNYRQLIPRSFEREITVERRQLLAALERIGVLADQKNNIVKFTIDSEKQELYLSVDAADVGSGRESMSAMISGESLEIAFNVKYAMESLKNIHSTEIQIKLNSATSPVVLTPLGGVKMTHLLMPVQIRN